MFLTVTAKSLVEVTKQTTNTFSKGNKKLYYILSQKNFYALKMSTK